MKVLYSWIEEYAKTGVPAEELAEKLTMLGMEVEGIQQIGGKIDKLTTGLVKSVEPHADSDHLSICKVEVPGEELQIICGADNVRAGIKVPVAQVGCVLPGDFKIKKAKIRGVASFGMICAKEELGLEEKSKGIWILDDDTPIGLPSEKIIGETDYVFEVALTSNRSDCLSVLGLAREAAAGYGGTISPAAPKVVEDSSIEAPSIEIKDPDLCPRYSGRIVKGVKVQPSPRWLAARLEACGMRSINNIVDVTNYVLLEYGHPLHAFDLHKLQGEKIVVRRAQAGEKLTTLDEAEHELNENMLVIADEKDAVALAGVMGGANSEVDDNSVDLLIESAFFSAISVRRSAKAAGLATEASYRFARTADWGATVTALDRCVELILETGGGSAGPITDNYAQPIAEKRAELTGAFLKKKLGIELPMDECAAILTRLGFEVVDKSSESIEVVIPTYRSDVSMEADLVEEIGRLYGYDKLPTSLFPIRVNEEVFKSRDTTKDDIRTILTGAGLQEVINYNFVLPEDMRVLGISEEQCVSVLNPMSSDQKYLRTSLLPNILRNVKSNAGHGISDIAFFEIGKVFAPGDNGAAPKEALSLAVVFSGNAAQADWRESKPRAYDFYDLSGVVELLCGRFNVDQWSIDAQEISYLHPGQAAQLSVDGQFCGSLGQLHPALIKELDVSSKLYIMELKLELLSAARKAQPPVGEISKFPSLLRDLAFVVDAGVSAGQLSGAIRDAASFLKDLQVVSVYTGAQIGENKKSVAFSMEFVCNERTLADTEVDAIQEKIIKKVAQAYDGVLR